MNVACITITVKGNTKHLYDRDIISKTESSDSHHNFDLNGIVRKPENFASLDDEKKWLGEHWGCPWQSLGGVCSVEEDEEKTEICAQFNSFLPYEALTTLANMFEDMEVTAEAHPYEQWHQECKEENGILYSRFCDEVEHMDRNGEWTCEEVIGDWFSEERDGGVGPHGEEVFGVISNLEDDNPF